MGDLVSRLRSEGPQIWRQLSIFQRATLIAVVVATVGAIAFLTQWAQQPEYSAVFTGLSESDASAIVAKLKETKVPYELANGGSTVRVPSDKVYDVRLQLVSQGLPKGGSVGYELFDKMSFGLTDFAQRLNYQRALEGELSRTISRIAGVEDARVHIVIPQNELFAAKEKPATASVALKLRAGSEPDSRQIQGIATLVARSVEGLKPENVTMVDGDGNLLSGGSEAIASVGARTSSQAEAQKGFEKTVQRDIQGMLEQVLGPRKAVVRVNMLLDWDQYESSTETYSPNGKPTQVRSAREITERSSTPLDSSGSGISTYPLSPAGQVGVATATPAPTAQANGAAATAVTATTQSTPTVTDPKYERREVTTNYEVSKLVEKMVKTPGAIKRQSISVMLDGQLDEATVATVTKAVGAAAGVDQGRGDLVVVTSMPFDRSVATADQQSQKDTEQRNLYFEVAKYVLAGLSLVIVLLMVRSFARGLAKGGSGRRINTAQAALDARREQRALAAAAARAALPEEDPRIQLTQGEITELAKSQPKLMAGIIKTWLDERETR